MRILVTGAAGFIGFALARRLAEDTSNDVVLVDNFLRGARDADFSALSARPNITALDLDLSAPDALERLPAGPFDFIFHLAAFNGTQNFYEHPYEVMRHSTLPTFALVEKYVVPQLVRSRFIYAGSSEAYAGTVSRFGWSVPTAEDVPLCIEDPTNARWSYGASKLHGEVLTCVACKQHDVPFTSIRYHNVYGPRMGDRHIIPDFVSRMSRGVYELFGHEDTRSFLYIDDAVEATLGLAHSDAARDQVVNVGGTDEITMKELGELMLRVADVTAPIVLHPSPAGSVKRRSPDVSRLKAFTGFEPRWSLDRGVHETVRWYLAHPNKS